MFEVVWNRFLRRRAGFAAEEFLRVCDGHVRGEHVIAANEGGAVGLNVRGDYLSEHDQPEKWYNMQCRYGGKDIRKQRDEVFGCIPHGRGALS